MLHIILYIMSTNFVGPQRSPWYPYVCTCHCSREFHWCPSGRSFVNYKAYRSWGDHPLVEIKEKSFKPYIKTEEGMMRPSNGRRYCLGSKGFYPMEDRMTEWKHDVPVGTMKMIMLLENRIRMLYHPDGEIAKDLKRKWDDLNQVNV